MNEYYADNTGSLSSGSSFTDKVVHVCSLYLVALLNGFLHSALQPIVSVYPQ